MHVAKKGADQLCCYRTADLPLWFRICKKPVFLNELKCSIKFSSLASLQRAKVCLQQNLC